MEGSNPCANSKPVPSTEDHVDLGGVPAALATLLLDNTQRPQGGSSSSEDYLGLYDPSAYSSPSPLPTTTEPEKPTCATHGIKCKKGICSDYGRQLKQWEREQAASESY